MEGEHYLHDHPYRVHRYLDEYGLDFDDVSDLSMLSVITTSFKVYGSLFVMIMIVYIIGRKYYPKVYNVMGTADDEELRTPLSSMTFGKYDNGFLSWMYTIFTRISDDEIYESCGLDAIVFIRTLRFGLRIALVGMLNSIYLVPVYVYGGVGNTSLEAATLGNIEDGHFSLIAAAVASYILFGTVMYLLYLEFEWFTTRRHHFLSKLRLDNYTVYVKNIPKEFQTDIALLNYFKNIFNDDYTNSNSSLVLEATLALDIPNLEKLVAEREMLIAKLEHAHNIYNIKSERPKHIPINLKKSKRKKTTKNSNNNNDSNSNRPNLMIPIGEVSVDSIDAWTEELEYLNDRVSNIIQNIQASKFQSMDTSSFRNDLEVGSIVCKKEQQHYVAIQKKIKQLVECETTNNTGDGGDSVSMTVIDGREHYENETLSSHFLSENNTNNGNYTDPLITVGIAEFKNKTENKDKEQTFQNNQEEIASKKVESRNNNNFGKIANQTFGVISKAPIGVLTESAGAIKASTQTATNIAKSAVIESANTVKTSTQIATNIAKSAATAAVTLISGGEDGNSRDAGFVTFSSLKVRACALQMTHDDKPFTMTVQEAPLPKDIFWGNVGLAHHKQQIGIVAGNALTVLLCVFWTIPVSFLTALGEVDKLKKLMPFLENWINHVPWIEMVLSQLKPLLLVIIVGMLPTILTGFSKREGHISETTLAASLFHKLSIFLLVQIFFVQMISGTLFAELKTLVENPLSIITTLAEALPKQAQSFMQYVVVKTSLNLSLEIVRVVPIVKAIIRSKFGPNLTEKERKQPWMGLLPISEAEEFDFADVQANLILYFMITLVYSGLAPIVSVIMAIAFLLLSLVYRNQLIYVYNTPSNDTGGQLFNQFASLVMTCMIIAEITMFGVLSMKRGATAAPIVIPLIVITVMFNTYLKQEHYAVSKHLPSKICVQKDIENNTHNNMTMASYNNMFLQKGSYIQPALQIKRLVPDNIIISTSENNSDYDNNNNSTRRLIIDRDSQFFFTPDNSQCEEDHEPKC